MIEVKGEYNTAIVYQDEANIELACLEQIKTLIDSEAYRDSKVRIMPDAHVGVSSCIGFSATFTDKLIPATVGVDVSCGMRIVKLRDVTKDIDFKAFDEYIRNHIPVGKNVRDTKIVPFPDIPHLRCYRELKDSGKFERALGTLGGG